MTTPTVKCSICGDEEELYLGIYPPWYICQDCGEQSKCPKCKNNELVINRGSTNFIPINNHKWALCTNCLFEWDLQCQDVVEQTN